MTTKFTYRAEGRTLTLERVFDAPRDLVFSMWIDGEKLKEWWIPGPGWTLPFSDMDFTVGGKWHYMMKGPDDGSDYANMESWGVMTYIEIDPPSKIVYEDAFTDESGTPNTQMPSSRTTLRFIEEEGKTHVVSTTDWEDAKELEQVLQMGMIEGVKATFDHLDVVLARAQAM
jgi:uncharacterized protein YndB with AHSA1/START domain